ncbi:hypothetical protein ORJ66_05475 [Pseudoalteromonas tunicata]|uniref:hypothetical protein n=1 Tax=Pseudoalteromonas tunicata TaxID=314281 RepID=UPI00273D4635|nr:hypothetical protein [Pseudoalteromonas tunicata]MDP5212488.1 hypothetical protein [Pseudoalteromonas tunicata]
MKKTKVFGVFVVLLNTALMSSADAKNAEIIMHEITKLDFNMVIPRVGSCHYDVKSDEVIHGGSKSTCTFFDGKKGKIKLIAEPLKTINVELKTKTSADGKVIFSPEGIAKVGIKEYALYTDTPVNIILDESGVVEIETGGSLKFTSQLGQGLEYSVDYGISYKYVE